jgi:hypothetical protein
MLANDHHHRLHDESARNSHAPLVARWSGDMSMQMASGERLSARSARFAIIAALMVGALASTGASPARAAESAARDLDQPSVTEAQIDSSTGALGRVRSAQTVTEKVHLLEQAGFVRVSPQVFELDVAGLVVGYRLPPDRNEWSTSHMSVGWNWGPYIRGTLREWQDLIAYGAIGGGGACTLITNALGSGACIALAGIAVKAISDLHVPNVPHACIAIQGVRWWAERC